MIGYVTVGADDIEQAKAFYSAFLPALGYNLQQGSEGLSYVLPVELGTKPFLPDFYVKPTFNGAPASAGNGAMLAFEARSQSLVRELHAAALAAGARCVTIHTPGHLESTDTHKRTTPIPAKVPASLRACLCNPAMKGCPAY